MGGTDYNELTVEDLKEEARGRGIVRFSDMRKDELVATLEADDRGELPTDEGGDDVAKEKADKMANPERDVKGTPPQVGNEGGVVEEGTGDFAPGARKRGGVQEGVPSVTVEDSQGNEIEVEAGINTDAPVSPQNPRAKALLGGGRPGEADNNEFAEPSYP